MSKNESNELWKKIQTIRKKLGFTQDELSRKADVPYTTLTKIEIGVIKAPSVFVIVKIAQALGTTVEELISEK